MALIEIKPLIESFNRARGLDTRRFSIPKLNPGVSDEFKLIVPPVGLIVGFKIASESANLDLYLFNRPGVDITGELLDYTYKKLGINKSFGFSGTGDDNISPNEYNIFYVNEDKPKEPAIYLQFKNNDVAANKTFLWLTISQD